MSAGAAAWLALAALLAAGALLAVVLPSESIAWRHAGALQQPWRWWTGAWVHWSGRHLAANLAGLGLVAALGPLGALPRRAALAWALAWPLTQLGLLARPDLAVYGGLSGVLHAGTVVAAWHLLRGHRGLPRAVGWALLLGVTAKVLLESPWGPAVRHPADWDIPIAPFAHATGAVAGLLCALTTDLLHKNPDRLPPHD